MGRGLIGRIDQETSLALLRRLPSIALAAVTRPIGAKAQPHASLLERCRHSAQEGVIVFVLIRFEFEITRDPAQAFISNSFDKFPHEAVIGLPC